MSGMLVEDVASELAKAKEKIEQMQPLLLKAASLIEGWNEYYKIYSMEECVSYYHDICKFTQRLRKEAQ